MRMKFTRIVAVLALGALAFVGASPANATDPPVEISPAEEQASRNFMTEFGVEASTQDALLDKVRAGEPLLSDVSGAAPVDVEAFTSDGSTFEVATFADASISVVEREIPVEVAQGGIMPLAVTGCSVSGGSTYTTYNNCKIHYRTVVFSYGFYSTFTMTGGSATISSAYGKFQEYAIGHTRDSWNLSIIRKTGNSSNPAHVRLSIQYTIYPGIGQIAKGVRLKANGQSYWQENS